MIDHRVETVIKILEKRTKSTLELKIEKLTRFPIFLLFCIVNFQCAEKKEFRVFVVADDDDDYYLE